MMTQTDKRFEVAGEHSAAEEERLDALSFLHYGYVPTPNSYSQKGQVTVFDWSSLIQHRPMSEMGEEELVAMGVAALRESFADTRGRLHVVPISGGLDSRAVLGGLLERVEPAQIVTVTFGVPGAMDFEVGAAVARRMGLPHVALNLEDVEPTVDGLLRTAHAMDRWTFLFDAFYNRIVTETFGKEAVYWSGFMGDPLAGSHLSSDPSPSWEEARRRFAGKNRFVNEVSLTPPEFRAEEVLPMEPLLPPGILEFDEQLDFIVRQGAYVYPTVLAPGFDVRTPFLAPTWVSFMLNVPRHRRMKKALYRKILADSFPSLFAQPTGDRHGAPGGRESLMGTSQRLLSGIRAVLKSQLPGPINSVLDRNVWPGLGVFSRVNYIDFDVAVRSRPAYRQMMKGLITALQERLTLDWLDLEQLWKGALQARPGSGTAIALLGALELSIRSREHP